MGSPLGIPPAALYFLQGYVQQSNEIKKRQAALDKQASGQNEKVLSNLKKQLNDIISKSGDGSPINVEAKTKIVQLAMGKITPGEVTTWMDEYAEDITTESIQTPETPKEGFMRKAVSDLSAQTGKTETSVKENIIGTGQQISKQKEKVAFAKTIKEREEEEFKNVATEQREYLKGVKAQIGDLMQIFRYKQAKGSLAPDSKELKALLSSMSVTIPPRDWNTDDKDRLVKLLTYYKRQTGRIYKEGDDYPPDMKKLITALEATEGTTDDDFADMLEEYAGGEKILESLKKEEGEYNLSYEEYINQFQKLQTLSNSVYNLNTETKLDVK